MARIMGTISSKDNLCNYCCNEYATCPKANHIRFGDGVGNDNVTECSEYAHRRYFNNYPVKGIPGMVKRA